MKRFQIVAGLLVGSMLLTGCTKESEPGGPGATGTTTGTVPVTDTAPGTDTVNDNDMDDEAEEHTFQLEVPAQDIDITQGETDEVTVQIDREDEFTQAVKVEFTAPAGLTVTPQMANVAADKEDIKITIAAAADAVPGKSTITVKATPTTGKAVSQTITVAVKKAE